MLSKIFELRKPNVEPQIFFIHLMKTAGTSFRQMLLDQLDENVYPSDADLKNNKNRWYLNNHEIVDQVTNGALNLSDKKVICGHYSYQVAKAVAPKAIYATILRHPVDRSVSMIYHRKKRFPELEKLTIIELLEDKYWVDQQIRNYQTKVFAINDLSLSGINLPYQVDKPEYDLAVKRLNSMDFVGLTENFSTSLKLFHKKTGVKLRGIKKENVGSYPALKSYEKSAIEELLYYDIKLYSFAQKKFQRECLNYGFEIKTFAI